MTSLSAQIAIETQDLRKSFPRQSGWRGLFSPERRTALDGVTLRVNRGEVCGILGPNGAGKTTLMKILATLVRPTSGRALVNGLDVVRYSTEVRRSIGIAYGDERTFFWRLSVRENLRFYAALYRIPPSQIQRRVDELLEMVGLSEAADLRMYSFSTGMKQRAAIARGLLTRPEILLMDEPTRSLDPVTAYDLRRLIRRDLLADGRRSVLLATNNMQEAEELCDRLILINKGLVQLMGTVEDLRRSISGHDRYILLVGEIGRMELTSLRSVPGVISVSHECVEDGRWRVELSTERHSEAVPRAVRCIVEAGGSVWSCAAQEPTLDDVFRLTLRAGEDASQLLSTGILT